MLERLETTEGLSLEKLGDEVRLGIEAGDVLFDAVESAAERVEHSFSELAEPVAELAKVLGELASQVGELFGEYGSRVGELLSVGLEHVAKGAEWLAENPEVVGAAIRLVCLVEFGIENPEMLAEILTTQPGAIESVIEACKPLLEALG
jgi:hypothetical protein